jgi:hypothetical protein
LLKIAGLGAAPLNEESESKRPNASAIAHAGTFDSLEWRMHAISRQALPAGGIAGSRRVFVDIKADEATGATKVVHISDVPASSPSDALAYLRERITETEMHLQLGEVLAAHLVAASKRHEAAVVADATAQFAADSVLQGSSELSSSRLSGPLVGSTEDGGQPQDTRDDIGTGEWYARVASADAEQRRYEAQAAIKTNNKWHNLRDYYSVELSSGSFVELDEDSHLPSWHHGDLSLPWYDASGLYQRPNLVRNTSPETVYLQVVSASGLPVADQMAALGSGGGSSDPYVKFTISGVLEAPFSTFHCSDTLDPVWGAQYMFAVRDKLREQDSTVLRAQVWDWDKTSQDDVLGQFSVSLTGLRRDVMVDRWYPLEYAEGGQMRPSGSVRLRILRTSDLRGQAIAEARQQLAAAQVQSRMLLSKIQQRVFEVQSGTNVGAIVTRALVDGAASGDELGPAVTAMEESSQAAQQHIADTDTDNDSSSLTSGSSTPGSGRRSQAGVAESKSSGAAGDTEKRTAAYLITAKVAKKLRTTNTAKPRSIHHRTSRRVSKKVEAAAQAPVPDEPPAPSLAMPAKLLQSVHSTAATGAMPSNSTTNDEDEQMRAWRVVGHQLQVSVIEAEGLGGITTRLSALAREELARRKQGKAGNFPQSEEDESATAPIGDRHYEPASRPAAAGGETWRDLILGKGSAETAIQKLPTSALLRLAVNCDGSRLYATVRGGHTIRRTRVVDSTVRVQFQGGPIGLSFREATHVPAFAARVSAAHHAELVRGQRQKVYARRVKAAVARVMTDQRINRAAISPNSINGTSSPIHPACRSGAVHALDCIDVEERELARRTGYAAAKAAAAAARLIERHTGLAAHKQDPAWFGQDRFWGPSQQGRDPDAGLVPATVTSPSGARDVHGGYVILDGSSSNSSDAGAALVQHALQPGQAPSIHPDMFYVSISSVDPVVAM